MISLTVGEWLSSNLFDCISLVLAVIGGFFALQQWRKSNIYKRGEIVENLIKTVRDDEDIATIMDVVDWNGGIEYDGKFYISQAVERSDLNQLDNEELFKKVDKALAHFSYVCYLRSQKTLTKEDMKVFAYGIKRLAVNPHIANYLYSLYHWSTSIGVQMSYIYLVDYCIEQGYIYSDFKSIDSNYYKIFLQLPNDYLDKEKSKVRIYTK